MAGAGKPDRADAADNRARILQAARRLFTEGGAPPSIDAVAAAAGVGKGTVFRRFGDRAGLIEAMLDGPAKAFTDSILHGPPPLGPGAPAAQRLEAFIDAYLEFVASETPLVRALDDLPIRSPMLGVPHLHVRVLVAELAPGADTIPLAEMLMSALSPATISRLLDEGNSLDQLRSAAHALVGAVTGQPSWPSRVER